MSVSSIPPVKQHRRIAFRCSELQPSRRRLIGGLHFGDHAAERPVAQRVLTHREQFLVIPALRIEDALWPKPRLFEPRGVKIETRQRPESRKSRRRRETRGDPGDEQGRCCVVAPTRRGSGDLVKARAIKPAAGQTMIERPDAERQHRAARRRNARHRLAKRLKLFGTGPGL